MRLANADKMPKFFGFKVILFAMKCGGQVSKTI